MYLERCKQHLLGLNEELGGPLEKAQIVDLLMRSSSYPDALSGAALLCKADLLSSFPDLSLEMQAVLSPFRTGLERVEPQALLRLAQKHYRVLQESYPTLSQQTDYLARQCPDVIDTRLRRPEAQIWLAEILQGKADLNTAQSQRFLTQVAAYQGVQYRGEHGDLSEGMLQTRLSQYAFAEKEIAKYYALNPNNRNDIAESPRVIEAELTMYSPFSMEKDTFVDFKDLRSLFQDDAEYVAFVRGKLDYFCSTDNFTRVRQEFGFDDDTEEDVVLDTLVKEHGPDVLERFYIDAYVIFDDPEILGRVKRQGFDGVAHIGNGESAGKMEYKVFYPDQITITKALAVTHRAEVEIPLKETMADKYPSTLKRGLRGLGV